MKEGLKEEITVQEGSDNIFADLRLPDAEDELAKAKLARRICQVITKRKLTQVKAAATLGLDQPKVSALMRGKLGGFSTDRLFVLLNKLNQDVEIRVRPVRKAGQPGRTRVIGG